MRPNDGTKAVIFIVPNVVVYVMRKCAIKTNNYESKTYARRNRQNTKYVF